MRLFKGSHCRRTRNNLNLLTPFEELARTTEPGSAEPAHVSGGLEGRAGPVWAFKGTRANGVRRETVPNSSSGARRTLCASKDSNPYSCPAPSF